MKKIFFSALFLIILVYTSSFPNLKIAKKMEWTKVAKTTQTKVVKSKPKEYYEELIKKGLRADNLKGLPDPYHKEVDYIDYAEVAGKDVCYVLDFDTPIKKGKKIKIYSY